MNKYTAKSLLFFVLFTFFSATCLAEEIETLSIPIEEDVLHPFKFIIKDSNGSATNALLIIVNNDTKENLWLNVSGTKEISLPQGKYTVTIDAGLRRATGKFDFSLPATGLAKKNITITPYAPIEPAGWIMIDPFYNTQHPLSKTSLSALADSLGIRVIFTPSNSILSKPENFHQTYQRAHSMLAPVTPYIHNTFGEVLAFNSFKADSTPRIPTSVKTPLYPLLASQQDANNLIALSPVVYYKSRKQILKKPAEEFIFDTIAGPLYNLLLLDNFDSSIKVWQTLLNLGYRMPAIYIGNNNFYRSDKHPSAKLYVKIPRKIYSQKMLHKALNDGKSVISNGPFIRFFIESIGSKGSTHQTGLDNDDWINGHSLKIGGVGFTSNNLRNIYAESFTCSNPNDKVKSLELIYNGKIIKKQIAPEDKKYLNSRWKVKLDRPGWVQLRYRSLNGKFHAITNPIYLIDYQSSPPSPALAKTQIQVFDAATNKPIKAKVMVENFGVITDSIDISEHATVLQTPATANIIVEANGYKTAKKSIYLDGGGARYIKSLSQKKLLDKALLNPISYSYLQKSLNNSKLTFKLKSK